MSTNVSDLDRDTMSLEELAARIGIGMTTAYRLAKRDALPIPRIPVPGPYKFSRRAYDELMSRQHDAAETAGSDAS